MKIIIGIIILALAVYGLKNYTGAFMQENIIGKRLPTMTLPSSDGGVLKIPDDLLGSYTVLFFYPKDQTPGCTKEACSFRDNKSEFKKAGAQVYGVSADSLESHQKFIDKHELNFPLLTDENKQLAKALGSLSFLGMISRDTFLIDPEARIIKLWRKVDALGTVSESLEELKKINNP